MAKKKTARPKQKNVTKTAKTVTPTASRAHSDKMIVGQTPDTPNAEASNKSTASPKTRWQKLTERSAKTPYSRYTSFRLQPRIRADKPILPGSFRLLKQSLGILKRAWKPFLGIVIIYGIFNIILVQSFASLDLTNTRGALEDIFRGQWNQLLSGLSLFAYLVGSATTATSQVGGVYQLILILLSSLAIIWMLRQVYMGQRVRVRDAYYKGMYPLIPFILVLAVIVLQLVPVIIGSYLYGFAGQGGGLQATELTLWLAALFMLTILSLYMVTSSLFALYIACLPEVTPMQALRSARQLVRYRRWTVMRRILFLPLVILVVTTIIMVPTIIFIERAAVWLFFVLTMFLIPIVHAYMYNLYRELLKENE